jgi:holo-[acyl-carrier protein] synthase
MRIGVDIVEVKRIGRLTKDKHFLTRVYTPEEIRYCSGKKNAAQHFAVRFSAKEAVWKALKEKNLGLKDIGVRNLPGGKPEAVIRGKRRKNIDISLSHTDEYAVAVALVQ